MTAEVVRALRGAGIQSILLKGPTLASWLYADGTARYYVDSDLWVDPTRLAAAREVLRGLGFRPGVSTLPPARGQVPHAEPWLRRPGRGDVDLHRTLSGLAVAPEEAWRVLWPMAELMDVGGERVEVLSLPARAMLVAFHAAQHGDDKQKPIEDLRRALDRVPVEVWGQAAALARRLDGTAALAAGLRMLPAGASLADRLGLVSVELVDEAVRPGSRARLALGFDHLASTRGVQAKVRLLAREFSPSADFLRWWSPLARRGRTGLLLVRLWRPVWLLWHAVPSVLAWRRGRRPDRGA